MDGNFAGLCENVNNFSKDGIFASDTGNSILIAGTFGVQIGPQRGTWIMRSPGKNKDDSHVGQAWRKMASQRSFGNR